MTKLTVEEAAAIYALKYGKEQIHANWTVGEYEMLSQLCEQTGHDNAPRLLEAISVVLGDAITQVAYNIG
jgi:hypothetical protein